MENSEENSKTSLLQNFTSKDRSVNFSRNEVLKLQMLVDKYIHILMCKKTDGSSTKQREKVWSAIHTEFNATGQLCRSLKQLKYKFENMKKSAKKEATKERQEMIRTGGGKPPTLPPDSEDATDWLRSVMSVSIDGNESIYDDDTITVKTDPIYDADKTIKIINPEREGINLTQKAPIGDVPTNRQPFFTEVEIEMPGLTPFDYSTPHSSLKKPLSAPLKRQILKKKDVAGDNIVKKALRERKSLVLADLNEIEKEKLRNSIDQQKELHQQIMRHNKEKHDLEILKLQQEIELLKKKLSSLQDDE